MSTVLRDLSSFDMMPSHIESSSRIFGPNNGKATFRSGFVSHDTNRLNTQSGSSNNIENISFQRSSNSAFQCRTVGPQPFGFRPKNFNLNSTPLPEGSFRLNQDIRQRHNNTSMTSSISKHFSPAVRNTTLTTGLQMQDSIRYNEDNNDSSVFRKPTLSKIIRGRNSTLQSRLFHNQNTERHYKDLSNINGFNVSHISRRELDTFSESRFGLNTRSNWIDNQSVAGSVLSVASMKAQFINLLENLHHSILNIGPHVTAEAVRMEFDKAKQGLESISEMSFAPSVRPTDADSVINQSSKQICPPPVSESASDLTNRKSYIPTSSFDMLKKLILNKNNSKNIETQVEEKRKQEVVITPLVSVESDNEENSNLVFKKSKPLIGKRKSLQGLIIKAPQPVRTLSKVTDKSINLKQWYPVADGCNLTFCGVNEEGTTVKTDAVKKRLNNRKVELVSGLNCNLIGSPSSMVSVFPSKVITMLKNGLTDRWKVLQRELFTCQAARETEKRTSKSPKKINSAEKKIVKSPKKLNSTEKKVAKSPGTISSGVKKVVKTPEKNTNTKKGKSKNIKVISTPKKKMKVAEVQTRSGRTVKPPAQFWLATGSNEVTSSLSNDSTMEKFSAQKSKSPQRTRMKKSGKASSESLKKIYKNDGFSSRETKASPRKGKEAEERPKRFLQRKPSKPKSPKKNEKVESEEEIEVHSSTEDAKRQKSLRLQEKRKREVAGETDSFQTKKSKLEKKTEVEVESIVETTKPVLRKRKRDPPSPIARSPKTKNKLSCSPRFPKTRGEKKKKETLKKRTVKNATENNKETSEMIEMTEFEKNFEFRLDDIEIPEIANVSGNPQLSKSQLRLVSMETPPLKYFNSNLRLLRSATPVRSPDWTISQRTESEVKRFQKRREEAFKKKIKIDVTKKVITETKDVQYKDVKKVMEWVAEKTVRSPQFGSEVLQYVIRSRKQVEEDDDEDVGTEFL